MLQTHSLIRLNFYAPTNAMFPPQLQPPELPPHLPPPSALRPRWLGERRAAVAQAGAGTAEASGQGGCNCCHISGVVCIIHFEKK